MHAEGETAEGRIFVPGRHMVQNAMLAVAAGLHFGVPLEDCLAGLGAVRLTKGRLEQKTIRGISILDDSYNANPDSMVAALQTLGQMPGRRIAVLGQMNELGSAIRRGPSPRGRSGRAGEDRLRHHGGRDRLRHRLGARGSMA